MNPYEATDQWLRRTVTRGEHWIGLSDRQKYAVCTVLWLCYVVGSVPPVGMIAGLLLYPRFFLCSPDIFLNVRGLLGRRTMMSDRAAAVDENDQACASVNVALRLPVVIATVLLLLVAIGGAVDARAVDVLRWSIALLALAASMYMKDTDVRLLDREPAGAIGLVPKESTE